MRSNPAKAIGGLGAIVGALEGGTTGSAASKSDRKKNPLHDLLTCDTFHDCAVHADHIETILTTLNLDSRVSEPRIKISYCPRAVHTAYVT